MLSGPSSGNSHSIPGGSASSRRSTSHRSAGTLAGAGEAVTLQGHLGLQRIEVAAQPAVAQRLGVHAQLELDVPTDDLGLRRGEQALDPGHVLLQHDEEGKGRLHEVGAEGETLGQLRACRVLAGVGHLVLLGQLGVGIGHRVAARVGQGVCAPRVGPGVRAADVAGTGVGCAAVARAGVDAAAVAVVELAVVVGRLDRVLEARDLVGAAHRQDLGADTLTDKDELARDVNHYERQLRAERELGYRPVPIPEMVRDAYEWLRDEGRLQR